MTRRDRIAIVGASLAGIRTAEFLRRKGFEGELTMVGDEGHLPYDRPPLSKEVIRGEMEPEKLSLRRKSYDELRLDLQLGSPAVALDVSSRTVQLESGQSIDFDALVVATGARPRRLPGQPPLGGLFTLRTLDDALAIRESLRAASRVAVIGAGFIGAEVAASARQLGREVTMIEALETPLATSLGPELGSVLQTAHERRGVEVLCGKRVREFVGCERVEALVLDDGTTVRSDLVVVGIGVEPSVVWLEESGLELEDGIRCDAACRASAEGIFGAGDCASWYNPLFEEQMRVEHWTNAVEQARHVAHALLSDPANVSPFESVPMFWSDQFNLKVQGVGHPKPTDDLSIRRVDGDPDALVAIYSRGERCVGAVTINQPPKVIALRKLIADRGTLSEAMSIAEQ